MRLADKISRGVGNELRFVGIIDQLGPHVGEVDAGGRGATPVAVRRMQSSICFMVPLLNVRNVQRINAVCGMTL
jgi:hypothetical protein